MAAEGPCLLNTVTLKTAVWIHPIGSSPTDLLIEAMFAIIFRY